MYWKGVFPALTTPFTDMDTLDLVMLEKSVRRLTEAGVHGLILGGTLGEASTLRFEEKETLVRNTLNFVNGTIPVILNIAEGSLHEALRQVKAAESWGVSGFMLLPPMRYYADARETIQYFRQIAESTSLPFIIYNNPVDYKIEVTLDMFEALANVKNIESVKESTREVTNITRLINAFGDRFQILCGVDTLALESLALGACGWVAGLVCAFPKETMAVYNHFQRGEWQKALDIYRWFLPLLELDLHPKLVQYIKLAASIEGIGSEFVRPPRLVLEWEEKSRIEQIIRETLKTRPAV
jgi:4-hydroxy-tetrahydrodipicolinate synthase